MLNDIVTIAFSAAGILVTNEPVGFSRSVRKRPDGITLFPWQSCKALCRNVTVICTTANSCMNTALQPAGAVVELAATRNQE
jgi:hypothetical protein